MTDSGRNSKSSHLLSTETTPDIFEQLGYCLVMWVPSYTHKKRPGEIGADGEVEAGGVAGGALSLRAAAQRRGPGVCPRLPLLLPGHPAASRGAELPGLLPRGEALGVSLAPCLAGVGALSQGHGQGCHPVFSACWVCVLVPCLVRANVCQASCEWVWGLWCG